MSSVLLLLLSLLQVTASAVAAINTTALLSPYPTLSSFSNLLTTSSLSSLPSPSTLLAVPNSFLLPSHLPPSSSTSLSDLLLFHVIPLSLPSPVPASGVLLPTLLSSTGRSSSSLNFSRDPDTGKITIQSPSSSSANVVSVVRAGGGGVAILAIDSFLFPSGYDLMANEARPASINISKALIDAHGFNVFAAILTASGVIDELQKDESGAGITMFVPTDVAFANIPSAWNFQSLSSEQKAVVLRFHCLHSYYPLGSLQAIVNPVQPTLATEMMGAGSYTLNIKKINGSVSIGTGMVRATVDQTVFDENPVAIFGISSVLLPKEIFGKDPVVGSKRGEEVRVPPPEAMDGALSPVGDRGGDRSGSAGLGFGLGLDLVCLGWLLYLLL